MTGGLGGDVEGLKGWLSASRFIAAHSRASTSIGSTGAAEEPLGCDGAGGLSVTTGEGDSIIGGLGGGGELLVGPPSVSRFIAAHSRASASIGSTPAGVPLGWDGTGAAGGLIIGGPDGDTEDCPRGAGPAISAVLIALSVSILPHLAWPAAEADAIFSFRMSKRVETSDCDGAAGECDDAGES